MDNDKLIEALIKAQSNFGSILADSVNPAFKSKYASLGSIIKTVQEMLNDHGLAITEEFIFTESGHRLLKIILNHVSGQKKESVQLIDPDYDNHRSKDQAYGACITYLRRTGIKCLLNIEVDKDTDGNPDDGKVSSYKLSLLKKAISETTTPTDMESLILKRLEIAKLDDMPWKEYNAVIGYVNKNKKS